MYFGVLLIDVRKRKLTKGHAQAGKFSSSPLPDSSDFLLLTCFISGKHKYVPNQGTIAYISDVGASFLEPLFVVASCITGLGLVLSLAIERLLRHKGRLVAEHRRRERVFGQLAVVGAFIAMLGLAFLSGFDTGRYPTAHKLFLLVFMIGVSFSAIFTVIEFGWLAHDYPEIDKLKRAYVVKAAIGLTLVGLAIVFGVTLFFGRRGRVVNRVQIHVYLLTFAYNLRMAKGGTEGSEMVEMA